MVSTFKVEIFAWRRYDAPVPWLLTAMISLAHSAGTAGAYPQAYAVTDDYGNLVIVGAWA